MVIPDKVTIDEALLERLWKAQMVHTRHTINTELPYMGDDGYDYLTAALELCQHLTDIYYERDLKRLDALLNTPSVIATDNHYLAWEDFHTVHHMPPLEEYASDGVCPELYDLNCPALPKED